MYKPRKLLSLLLACVMALSLTACGDAAPENEQQRFLRIVWPTLSIDFYSTMAGVMTGQAEESGWKVEVESFDFDPAVQASQLEDCAAAGVTDIITCAPYPDAVEETCIRLRQQGINISIFALAPDNPEAYDSATAADQYRIGEAIAANASDWVDETFPDAADGSVDAILITVPVDSENVKRAQGMAAIADNPKINVLRTVELNGEDPAQARAVIDQMMQDAPETRVVLCHFSSLALAADDSTMGYEQIDREHFGIFSGDWDAQLAARIQASERNESLIRATGTYATDAMEIQFHVCTGEYNRLLNDRKQYMFPVLRITLQNINDYLN